jgi:AcrR family transcriptional regulator
LSRDLRVRRTRKLLREALVELIEERSFEAVTVQEIAGRAMVSRAAFYRHYRDKYALVESIYEEVFATVVGEMDGVRRAAMDEVDADTTGDRWASLFERSPVMRQTPAGWLLLFEHFAQYERLYRALLGRNGSPWFARKLRAHLAGLIGQRLLALAAQVGASRAAENPAVVDGLLPAVIAAQIVEAVTWWLERGRPYPTERLAAYGFRCMCAVLRDLPAWD